MKKRFAAFLLFFAIFTLTAEHLCAQLNKPYFFYRGRELIIEGRYRESIEMLNLLLRTHTKEYEGFFLRGVAKYNLDDLLGAEADFTTALEINPVYTMAFQYRAITRSRLGNYNDAILDYQMAEELRPNISATYFSRGVTYFMSQQFESAVEDFTRFLRSDPNDLQALINRGTSYLFLKDTVRAYEDFNRAVIVAPNRAEGYMRRGLLEVAQNNNAEGIRDLSKAIELDAELAPAHFYRALAYVNDNRPVLGLLDLDRTIELDSTHSVAFFNRAILRGQMGDFNRAIEDYDRVARYNPGNVLVFYNRAAMKAEIGDYPGAVEDYTKAIELYPDFANAYLYRGYLKANMRDFRGFEADKRVAEQKITEYRNRLSDSTYSIFADTSRHFDRLLSFDADFGSNEFQSLIGDARNQIQMLPMFRITFVERSQGVVHDPTIYRNGRLERYLEQLNSERYSLGITNAPYFGTLSSDSVLLWDQENRTPIDWRENYLKGVTQALVHQYASALSYYRTSAREEAGNPFVYLNRGVTQAEMVAFVAQLEGSGSMQQVTIQTGDAATRLLGSGSMRRTYDYSEAIEDMRRAIELMPELPHAYYNLGNLYYMIGDMPGAIEQFSKAIELFPYFAEAYYNRGMVQIYLQDTQKGCLDLSKAGELGLSQAYEMMGKYCIKTN